MYQSFYCNGLGGYGYNPWFSDFYCGMSSLNSLVNSFRGNSRGNCSCNCQSNSNSSSGCSGNSGSGNIGHLLSGTSSSSGLDDGLGGLPMPGSNVPAYKPCGDLNSNIQIMPRPEIPIYSCDDRDPRYSGILSGDVSALGGVPPVTSPGLANLLRPDIGCMDPCTLAGLLMGRIAPAQAQQAAQAAPSAESAGVNVTTAYNGDAASLDGKLGGVLANKGSVFLEAQKQYGINAAFLASICINESGNGTSNLAKTKNNVGGVRISGSTEFRAYTSVDECIMDMARFLKSSYIDKGLTTIGQIGAKYCPAGDPTDKTGMNSRWAANVGSIMQRNFA